MTQVSLALGANTSIGDESLAFVLKSALAALEGPDFTLLRVSDFFRTPCFPAGAGPDYVNAAALAETSLSPGACMARFHAVEAAFGRERVQRWGQRTLDIDLLSHGDAVLPDRAGFAHWHDLDPERQRREAPDQLILPHPRLQDRAFVLVPLAQIQPDWRHPVLGLTVTGMLERLPAADRAEIRPL